MKQGKGIYEELCRKGLRVLAVAYRTVQSSDGFSVADEHSLILAGFLAFADPPTSDAATSLAAMRRDGVQVKILTGDNELVAQHICTQVRLENPVTVLGEELEQTTDLALGHRTGRPALYWSIAFQRLNYHSSRNGTPAHRPNGAICGCRVHGELGLGCSRFRNQHADFEDVDSWPDYRFRFRALVCGEFA